MTENVPSVAYPASLSHTRISSRRPLPSPPSSPTSLLERRTANGTVYTPDLTLPEHFAALADDPSFLDSVSSSNLFSSSWQPSRSSRPFSPLTPIMASPLTSPAPSMSPDIALSLHSDTEDERDRKLAHSESAVRTEITNPNPTWMSTPPTPPPKHVDKSSAPVTWRPYSSFVTASASFPHPALASVSKASSEVMKRRASLPPMSVSKPLPPIPPAPPPSSLKTRRDTSQRRRTRSPLRASTSKHSDERPHPTYQSGKPSSQAALRAKPLFHIPQDSSDKEDDDNLGRLNGYRKNSFDMEESRPEAVNHLPQAKDGLAKDDVRKCHALLELLSTEIGYFLDLKILVTVYLRLLPILTIRPSHPPSSSLGMSHFSRSNSLSFATYSSNPAMRMQSFPHLSSVVPLSPALISCENMPPVDSTSPTLAPVTKEKDKSLMRQIFSTADIELITRNAEDILNLHEQLVYELKALVSPLGFPMIIDGAGTNVTGMLKPNMYSLETLGSALDAVAMKFIEQAPGFDLYQSFCSRHPEAFNLVRKVQQEFPAEWDAFEQKCNAMAAEMRIDASLQLGTDSDNDAADNTSSESDWIARRRRHSLSSLHAPGRRQTLSRVRSNANIQAPVLSASESGHLDIGRKSKLVFMDYLIKPVQRICRYSLLLDQLQDHPRSTSSPREPSSAHNAEGRTPDVDVNVIQIALNAMRAMASSVDEARRRQDIAVKSSLIASRILQGLALVTAPHSKLASRNLSSDFISSLGPCHLAGSLDVIHYHSLNTSSSGTVKAKYLGAFLYAGGYLILAKVHKARTYEPKHWFSLAGFDLVDSTKDEALLPSWFRLSSPGHIFEFAASCRREKDVWKAAIHHVFELPFAWASEPLSSIRGDSKWDFVPSLLEDIPYEESSPLPTIQSIPELDNEVPSDEKHSLSGGSDLARSGPTSRADTLHKSDSGHQFGHSHRSSTISNLAYLGTLSESDTIHLIRATAPAREQVDRGLLDVFSESCLSARCYAHTHEEELFEASKVSRSFSRSSSGLTMAGAMSVAAKNRLTKRESVLVPRRKSYVDSFGHYDVSAPWVPQAKPGKKLKIIAVSRAGSLDDDEGRLVAPLESPSAMSQYSPVSVHDPEPISASPIADPSSVPSSMPPPSELVAQKEDFIPKRSRSMVENVRVLFSRSASPTLPLSREPSESSSGATTPSLRRWWSKGTLRRRARSAPDVPADEHPSDATASLIDLTPGSHPSVASTNRPVRQHDVMPPSSFRLSAPGSVGTSPPVRMRSLFGPQSLRRRSTTATSISSSTGSQEGGSTPRTVRMRRNLSFLSRLSPMTPEEVLQR
ncbi:hypothetical protein K503DRAFT_729141 [Rhizopogon vinicolor AM-OR11-026]|uniref:DH domain-containing protein n=1 Tax=Rhizopogon vinicolor AM-OR11-026 TaxID=1314800 RepID=A0A1B7NHX1_9AGAM|nr:hypothetical protein K503DRAFT_729141 [Rhizopogon vinicolor AM-OR11-026]